MSPTAKNIILIFIGVCTLILSPFLGDKLRALYNQKTERGIKELKDKNGLVIVDYGVKNNIKIGKHYNPTLLAQQGLALYKKDSLTENDIKLFWQIVTKLDDMVVYDDYQAYIPYTYPFPEYKVEKGWQSGMAQAQAIQLFMRAFRMSDDFGFIKKCELLLNGFYTPFEYNGFTYSINDSSLWYEEYADQYSSQPKVLNGMLYTLIGLYDYYQFKGSKKTKELFDYGYNGVILNLFKYDADYGSYYDIHQKAADKKYHQIHIDLLTIIQSVKEDPEIEKHLRKWKQEIITDDINPIWNKANLIAFLILIIGIFLPGRYFLKKLS